MRPSGRRGVGTPAAVALLVAGCALAGCSILHRGPEAEPAARAFLAAWSEGNLSAAAAKADDPATAQPALQAVQDALAPTKAELAIGAVTVDGDHATAAFAAAWTLAGVGQPWRYDGQLGLVRAGEEWKVHWQPSNIHPKLGAGQRIVVSRALPERAPLLDGSGRPLFQPTPVVRVGVEPRRVQSLPQLAASLAAALAEHDVRAADVIADVRTARPTDFVPVITLRRPDYLRVKARIHELPGTVFHEDSQLLGPSRQFAQPLLGRVGAATAEVLQEAGPAYRPGDQLGLSGLQRALNSRLAGTAGARISVQDQAGNRVLTLASLPGTGGAAVRTTLDRAVQVAADAAVASASTPAAIVAVRPSTGELLAVANNEQASADIALTGRYPAGSTFKTITATALLSAGVVRPDSMVACPGTTTVFGKAFQNEDRFDLGAVPLRTAFAQSCNTTFTALSQKLTEQALPVAAAGYGVGSRWTLPVPSFGGSLPAPKDATEKAADAIGQGKVEVSPLAMALVAAGVGKGGPVVPTLLAGITAVPESGPPAGPPAMVLPALRELMRAVVTDGTARALADLPGAPVFGKTGTAEYGTGTPPRSHAWFIGYRQDLAFAVFVQDGEASGRTAVPMARAFLAGLR